MALLQEQDEKAFSYLYDNYSGALFGIVHAIVPDRETAHDVLQLVFVNIWKKIQTYDPNKGRLFTWMLNIARNAAIDEIRSRAYRDSQKNQSLPENADIRGAVTVPVTEDIGLRKMLTRLKAEWRTLIELAYFQGLTHEEIAKAQNLPLGTVKTRIRTALQHLRNMMPST